MLTITEIKIENFKGIDSFGARLGTGVTIICGRNRGGKTSIREALQLAFEGGSAPSLIAKGAKEARIEIRLSDGTQITKWQYPKGAKLEVVTPEGGRIDAPSTYIQGLFARHSFDPSAFLAASGRDRIKILLEQFPVNFSAGEIAAATDTETSKGADLGGLAALWTAYYNKRTDINSRAKQADATYERLRSQIPAELDKTDWAAEAERARGEFTRLKAEEAKAGSENARAFSREREKLKVAAHKAKAEIEARLTSDLDRVAARERESLEAALSGFSDGLRDAQVRAERAAAAAKHQAALATLAREKEIAGEEARQFGFEADQLTKVLKRLNELRARKISEIPIEGLEIAMGDRPEVRLDGKPIENLSGMEAAVLCLRVAALQLGELPFMVIETDMLDGDSFPDVVAAVEEKGIQAVMVRWRTGEELQALSPEEYFAKEKA